MTAPDRLAAATALAEALVVIENEPHPPMPWTIRIARFEVGRHFTLGRARQMAGRIRGAIAREIVAHETAAAKKGAPDA